MGIAEQNAIGAASGLATTGMRPYVCAYAPFITARSMEQVRNDVAYANQRVVIGAAASGISLGVAGGTHHSLEDLALMRSLPNMNVIVPADVEEAYKATLATLDIDGPVYLRLGGRVEEPPVTDPHAPFRLGKAGQLRPGNDVAVLACGAMVEMAVRASDTLKKEGIGVRVLNMSSIKPFDTRCGPRCRGGNPRHRDCGRASPHRRPRRHGGRTSRRRAPDPHAHGRHARPVRNGRPDARGAREIRNERRGDRRGVPRVTCVTKVTRTEC